MIDHAGLIAARIFMAFLPWKQRLLIAWWRPSDVIEDLLDGAGIGNIGDDPQSATTLWTDRNIDIEYSLEPLCPGERSDERVLLRGVVGCFVCFVICLSFCGWPGPCRRGYDVFSQFRIGCQHAMVAHQVVPGSGHKCNQLADEVEGREHHVGGTIAEGMFELILHLSVGTEGQAVEADGGPGNIAA